MAESREGAALVHALVQLGKDLHLETVAEGIENDAHLRQVEAEGVDTGQGFLISVPINASGVNELLRISTTTGRREQPQEPETSIGDLARNGTTPTTF